MKYGKYRYWGDQKPDTSRPLLTVTRDAVPLQRITQSGADASGEAVRHAGTIRIYGPIDSWGGFWGVSAKEVAAALDVLGDVDQVVVRINSPGGDSFEGRAIMNLLRAHSAECIAIVDGLAASAASYIAVGCDETVMAPGTTLMIHDTSTYLYGNADELRKQADVVESISRSGSELYADVAGGTPEEWRARMRAETWYTATEAVAANLANRVGVVPDTGPVETAGDTAAADPLEAGDIEEAARAAYDLSLFDHAPLSAPQPPTASADGSTPTTEGGTAVAFSDAQITEMRRKLGVAEDADEATILAAFTEALDEQAEENPTASNPVVPEGMTLIETDVLAVIKADGAAGRAAREQQLLEHRNKTIDDAIKDGKITVARRAHYEKAWEADAEGTEQLLKDLEPGLVPVTELGHDQSPTSGASVGYDDDALAAFAEQIGTTKEDLQ